MATISFGFKHGENCVSALFLTTIVIKDGEYQYPVTPYERCVNSSYFDLNLEQALKMVGRNPVAVNS
ncbi:hypothetical protein L596_000651 [Steinernema carpocapsae]|uniref:Uncharacterized protein n=1 Tax=Steinernema carpocapsae TaxID=34508 RepID=A0A4U8UIU5_STECR|nr:hypothetical protein L596_000651 [Steinernema carpocapsae]